MTTGTRNLLIACLVVAAMGLALRLTIASRDIDVVDRLFIPDDTYYTLSIAHSLAHGLGPTVDGETFTNGFQPLIAFLQVPLFKMLSDPDSILRATLFLLCFVDAALALLLGRIAGRAAGGRAALLTTALWSFSPQAIDLCLGGLETTLALLCTAAVVHAWITHRERQGFTSACCLGLLIGLALLARVDTVFLVLIIGLYELTRGDRLKLALVIAASVLVVAPWWMYSVRTIGTFIPESGAAVRQIAFIYQGTIVLINGPVWGVGTILGGPFIDCIPLRNFLFHQLAVGVPLALVVGIGLGWLAYRTVRSLSAPLRIAAMGLGLHTYLLAAFYMFYVPAIWFFHRYLAVSWIGLCIVAGILAARWLEQHATSPLRRTARIAVAILWLVPLAQSSGYLTNPGDIADIWAIDGPTGYRAPMRAGLQTAPPDAVIGSFQTGALTYYADPNTRIVNLDGVVNRDATTALAERRIDQYAQEQGVTHFCDWAMQHGRFLRRSQGAPSFLGIGIATQVQQSGHRVRLSEIVYQATEGSVRTE